MSFGLLFLGLALFLTIVRGIYIMTPRRTTSCEHI